MNVKKIVSYGLYGVASIAYVYALGKYTIEVVKSRNHNRKYEKIKAELDVLEEAFKAYEIFGDNITEKQIEERELIFKQYENKILELIELSKEI